MPHSFAQIYLHLVFSTKGRQPFLDDREFRERVHEYLGGACNGLGCEVLQVGGIADHVHIACRFSRVLSVADFLKELKRQSTVWIKKTRPTLDEFHWQLGYGAFSISPTHVDPLVAYIRNQEAHHRTESFQDEFRRLLKKNGLEWDERYVWD